MKVSRTVTLGERDYAVLRTLIDSRVATTRQLVDLHFADAAAYAYKRLAALAGAGLIAHRERGSAAQQRLFYLTKAGFDRLSAAEPIDPPIGWSEMERRLRNLSDLFFAHELAVLDTRVALERGLRTDGRYTIERFSTWPKRHGFDALERDGTLRPMRPDAFLRISWQDGADTLSRDFFIEVDRSEEVLADIQDKLHRYRWYTNSGGYARDFCGVDPADITPELLAGYHFTVLVIVPTPTRQANIARALLTMQSPIKQLAWLTTAEALANDPLGRIWSRPKDYLAAHRTSTADAVAPPLNPPVARWALLDEPA